MARWEYRWHWDNTTEAKDLLQDGWEPFSVTESRMGARIWFRRPDPDQATARKNALGELVADAQATGEYE